jgi:bifunctional enzyme CysN/CysC
MSSGHTNELIAEDIEGYLARHEHKGQLQILTCGSVDDGKSTLIGRLLHDSHMVYEDQLAALHKDSATLGHAGEHVDMALLTDGLKAEREQGITIDVAYRYFSTENRKFIIADTPGHEQYTRNMVTGASTSQLAVILIDARHGVITQTRRHSYIASLLGIRHVVVAINKMDLVDWSRERFGEVAATYRELAAELGGPEPSFVPISALLGDNVVDRSENLKWYHGPTLLEHLESVDVGNLPDLQNLRLPVQLVSRPDSDFRGFAGTIASGTLAPGDQVRVEPSGVTTTISRIVTFDGDLDIAGPGQAVTVTTRDEVDISRGDVLAGMKRHLHRAHHLEARLVWMAETPAVVGNNYLLQHANRYVGARLSRIEARIDVNTSEATSADAAELNDIVSVQLETDSELLFDPYEICQATGSFILIDRLTNATVAAGTIERAATEAGSTNPVTDPTTATAFLTQADRPTIARALARAVQLAGHARSVEVFLDPAVGVCRARNEDTLGTRTVADLVLDPTTVSIEEGADQIAALLSLKR